MTSRHAALIAFVFLVLASQRAEAADFWHTSTLKWVYPQADGSFVLTFNVDSPNCSTSSPKYHHVAIGQNSVTEEGARKFYAAAMTALATRMTVQVNFSDASSACYINRLLVLAE